ncbi:hypothetical protein ACIQ1D_02475 [Lysinibacillus xylanilyticus]|uniref:hypothetical protein n=1 Tax=Lysinibacillus xylanilyticus TaxID=582475 RepID=UPI003802527E
MATNQNSAKLLHIQRKAIRGLLYSYVEERDLINRYRQITKQETSNIQEALMRTDKATLIKIVNKSPEITSEDVDNCFEEYRYSNRPNFQLFLLHPIDLTITSKKFFSTCDKDKGIQKLNKAISETAFSNDNLQELKIIEQTILDAETIEFSFSHQERYNYIDPETEDSASIFELKYGFLWVNVNKRFLSISVSSDSLTGALVNAVNKAFDFFSTSINITEKIVKSIFSDESMKRTSLYNPNPPEGYPEKISVSDANMGGKVNHLKNYEGYSAPSTVYQEKIDDENFTTLGVNCSKGKIYLTKQLRATQMRSWGLWRINQIMSYIQGVYQTDDVDTLFETIGIESDNDLMIFSATKEERTTILAVLKAIIKCKKQKINNYKLLEYNTESLFKSLKKHTTTLFQPYCEECNNYTELACNNCGHSEILQLKIKSQQPVIYCAFCYEQMDYKNLECLEGHKVKVGSWFEGVLFKPLSTLIELIEKLTNKYFKQIGFNTSEEYVYLHNNEVYYLNTVESKVIYNITEIDQFKTIWERTIPEDRKERLKEILKIIKEKCSKHSNDGCRACQDEKSINCIMKPFVTFTDHKLHPHQGHEFGDVSFNLDLPGLKSAVFVGIAKSYDKKTVTVGSDLGREMLEQFVSKCVDERAHVLGLICAANIDQGLIALLQDLARRYGKKVVMWTHDELLLAIDYSIEVYNLSVDNVKNSIEIELANMKRKGKKKAG